MTHRWERIALAAVLTVALGSACSSGDKGSGQGAIMNTGAIPGVGGQSANAGSGNSAGQPGANGQGGSGQPGGGTANGGAAGSAGTTTAAGAAAGNSGIGGPGGMTGAAGASMGGASSGGGTSLPDGGTCCKTADCQPEDVKTCVCTTWGQTSCCNGTWDTFCQTTAEAKCNAEKCLTATEPPPGPMPDGGDVVKGACCATHTTPGCADSATEACICQLLPDCCMKQWDSVCVELVRSKHCEAGVRDCVCMTWQQQDCCNNLWTDACGLVATSKCNAQPECP